MTENQHPFIIPIFLPNLGCPHKCIFCNQKAVLTQKKAYIDPLSLSSIINEYLQFYNSKKHNTIQIAFYGGNFLGLKLSYIEALLNEASKFIDYDKVKSIRLSTRPDTIVEEKLEFLSKYNVSTIELGVQSMDDEVLLLSERGHTSTETINAVNKLKANNYEIGIQLMIGLPGDNEYKAIQSAKKVIDISPDFVRISPTLVFENSKLAELYKKKKYIPLSMEDSIRIIKKLYILFTENKIKVIRMGLQPTKNFENEEILLAGPFHPSFGHLVISSILLDKLEEKIQSIHPKDEICIKINPMSESHLRGIKNSNIHALKKKYNVGSVKIIKDETLKKNVVEIIM
ncbi:MAG: radical SAM protein [Desulfobacterales bacterium]|nr:radical SAM protein [Desulfobacterales bacterium]